MSTSTAKNQLNDQSMEDKQLLRDLRLLSFIKKEVRVRRTTSLKREEPINGRKLKIHRPYGQLDIETN